MTLFRRIMALAGAFALAAIGLAGPQDHTTRSIEVRVGVLVPDSARTGAGVPQSAAPYALYNLDRALGIRPAGWNLVNPFGPSIVTAAIRTRWLAISGSAPALNAVISRRNAAYWEVFLGGLSDSAISRYDVLILAPRFFNSLNPAERNKLHRFVDQGGILWVDPSGSTASDQANSTPLPFVPTLAGGGTAFSLWDPTAPVLSRPNTLTLSELRSLDGGPRLTVSPVNLADEGADALSGLLSPAVEDGFRLLPVGAEQSSGRATVSVGRIGDGFMVVTARGAATRLSNVNGNANYGFVGRTDPLGFEARAAAKLAVNIISLRSEFRQVGGGSRKSGGSSLDVTAPLLKRFEFASTPSANPELAQPVLFRGLIIVSSGGRVYAYDARPQRDLDGDGDPDDGIRDFRNGGGVDLVWESPDLGANLSAPAAIEVPETRRVGGTMPEIQVAVTAGNGDLVILNGGVRSWGALAPGGIAARIAPPGGALGSVRISPTLQDGLAFMADGGRIWIADLKRGALMTSGTDAWVVGAPQLEVPPFTAGPTVAMIPTADNSGGMDRVLYAPFQASTSGSLPPTPGFVSWWLGTKGEKPVDYRVSGSILEIDTRASQAGNLPIVVTGTTADQARTGSLGVRVTLLRANGDPFTAAAMNAVFDGGVSQQDGQIRLNLRSGITQAYFNANVAGIRVDYTIDWGRALTAGVSPAIERGRLNLPTSDSNRRIVGNLAVTPRGTIFAVLGRQVTVANVNDALGNLGSVFAFRENVGRGAFRCVMRYDLTPRYSFNPSQSTSETYESNFRDQDGVQQFAPGILGGDYVTDPVFVGGPSVRGDRVYVTAAGRKGPGFIKPEVTMVLALKSEPETPTLVVGDVPENFALVQPDLLRSTNYRPSGTNPARPEAVSVIPQSALRYDRDTGVITLDNLMNVTRGQIQNCISLSQSVILRRSGSGDRVITPERVGGKWSPLEWYTVIHSMQGRTGPIVAGDNLYVAGSSLLPYIINTGSLPPSFDATYFSGIVFGLNVNFGLNDSFLVANPDRPWVRQMVQLRGSGASIAGNPNYTWPAFAGITGPSTFVQRLNQSVLTGSNLAYGIVAGDDTAVVWGNGGYVAFQRADILIADRGRVGRFDAAGNPLWTTDSLLSQGADQENTAGNVLSLSDPVRAYPVDDNDVLVVDRAANRLVRVTPAGTVSRSIETLQLDPNFPPQTARANVPLRFNAPSDVVSWAEYVDLGASPTVTNQRPNEFWRHYVVADTGNRRLVWVIDRLEVNADGRILGPVRVNNVPQLGVILWISPEDRSGTGFAYTSVTRAYVPPVGTSPGRYVYIAGVGTTPNRAAIGLDTASGTGVQAANDGNGGIVLFDTRVDSGSQAFNTMSLPDRSATPMWNERTNAFDALTAFSQPAGNKRIGSVRSVTAVVLPSNSGPVARVLFTDPTGVYEAAIPLNGAALGEVLPVGWFLPREAYLALRRANPTAAPSNDNARVFNPTFARRLENGDILLVNGTAGTTRGDKTMSGTFVNRQPFSGEVLQLDGSVFNLAAPNLGFYGTTGIRYELRRVNGARDLQVPVFADRK